MTKMPRTNVAETEPEATPSEPEQSAELRVTMADGGPHSSGEPPVFRVGIREGRRARIVTVRDGETYTGALAEKLLRDYPEHVKVVGNTEAEAARKKVAKAKLEARNAYRAAVRRAQERMRGHARD